MTRKQKAMLDAIQALTVDGVAPTYRDLQAHLGMTSLNNVHRLIHRLIEDGYLIHSDGRARSLRLVSTIDRASIETMRVSDLVALQAAISRRLHAVARAGR